MGLSYFGWTEEQTYAASFLKPDEEDKNVTPGEMVQFVNEQSEFRAITRMGGTLDLLKAFIAGGFPAIVSIGYTPEGEEWLGHYRAIVGYDDVQKHVYAYDSYLGTGENGQGIVIPYVELDAAWQHFNRSFIVLYRPEDEAQIAQILGERSDLDRAAELALEISRREAQSDPRNGFAWFNMGTALIALGQYEEAAVAYDRARQSNLPWRMLWYQFGPYEAYFNIGRYDDVMALVNANLLNSGTYVEETYFWQGQVLAAQEDFADAQVAFNRALQANPRYTDAQEALARLTATS
jgi:tetratricopeptide (TPR) repeat protein